MRFLSNQGLGALCAILSGLCYGFIGYFGITIVNSGLSVVNMLFWRFLVATFLMLLVLLPKYRLILKDYKENLKIVFYGIIFFGSSAIMYFVASKYIGTGLAMVIFFIYPAFVMLFNIFYYKLPINKAYCIAFSLLLIGVVCLIDIHEFTFDLMGIGLGILSAVLYTCYILVSKKSHIDPSISTLMVLTGCMILCLISAWVDDSLYIPAGIENWMNLICMAIFCTCLPIVLLLQGLKYISSEQASMLSVLEPVFVVIIGILLLDEKITEMQISGTVIIIFGALLTFLPATRTAEQQ